MGGIVSSIAVSALGFVYPGYCTFKALENNTEAGKEERCDWLVYWVVFALFFVIEMWVEIFAGILPLYLYVKLGFIVWLYRWKGAHTIYTKWVKPYLQKNEEFIDYKLNNAAGTAASLGKTAVTEVIPRVARSSSAALTKIQETFTPQAATSLAQAATNVGANPSCRTHAE